MKKKMSLKTAIFLLVAGLFVGSVFIFGVPHWNERVERNECKKIEAQFLEYKKVKGIHLTRPRSRFPTIAIYCTNGERYEIGSSCVNDRLLSILPKLSKNQNITLLLHPNSDVIVEFITEDEDILVFEDTIDILDFDRKGFLFLGIFMYVCALTGLYYIVKICVRKYNIK